MQTVLQGKGIYKELTLLKCPQFSFLYLISPFPPNRNQQAFLKGDPDYQNQGWRTFQVQVLNVPQEIVADARNIQPELEGSR